MTTHATALILGISNFVSLPEGNTENRLLLQLPNGRRIEAAITDDDLVAVAGCFGAPPEPLPSPRQGVVAPSPTPSVPRGIPDGAELQETVGSSPFEPVTLDDGSPAYVFGERPYTPAPPIAYTEPARVSRVTGKDDAGNPIVEVSGTVSISEVTGVAGDKDEDGVASV